MRIVGELTIGRLLKLVNLENTLDQQMNTLHKANYRGPGLLVSTGQYAFLEA